LAFSAASSFNANIRDGGVANLYTSLLIAWVCLRVIVETFWITLGSLAFALVVSPLTRLLQNLAEFWKGKSYPRLLASKTGAEALLALTVASIKVQESRSGVKTDPEGELVAVRRKGYDTARSQSN
jgi:hypothetical protein